MIATTPPRVELTCHASTPAEPIRRLSVLASRGLDGAFSFEYLLEADMSRLKLPKLRPAQRTDGLWRHTCFEAFIGGPDSEVYYEVNCAPSGEWALYRFGSYRSGMTPVPMEQPPQIVIRPEAQTLGLTVTIHPASLVELRATDRLRVALSSVIELENGDLSYWAFKHAPGRPDFHHPDGFALEL